MSASQQFSYRAKPDEEKVLILLAEYLERDISGTLRFAVRDTARRFGIIPNKKPPVIRKKQQEAKT